jgi:hypothetical protein
MSLNDFLVWLLSSGGNAIAASWILERIPWFQTLAANVKQTVFFVAVLALALGAFLVMHFVPAETLTAIAPYFGIVYATFTSVFLGTAFHQVDKVNTPKS